MTTTQWTQQCLGKKNVSTGTGWMGWKDYLQGLGHRPLRVPIFRLLPVFIWNPHQSFWIKYTSQCKDHLQTLSVQSKFEDSVELEESYKAWNQPLSGFHPGQLSFLLHAASDTLPTAVNLQWWSIQSKVKCLLCDSNRPTTAHVLSCCPTALDQHQYAFRHNQAVSILVSTLTNIFANMPFVKVYAKFLCEWCSSDNNPNWFLVTSYHPDIVIYTSQSPSITLLTCLLDSAQHIQAAWVVGSIWLP